MKIMEVQEVTMEVQEESVHYGLYNPQYKKKLKCIVGFTKRNTFRKNYTCGLYNAQM